MAKRYEYWVCPFCDEGKIEVMIFPKVYAIRKTYYGNIGQESKERFVVMCDCPKCNKKAEEIGKEWKKN